MIATAPLPSSASGGGSSTGSGSASAASPATTLNINYWHQWVVPPEIDAKSASILFGTFAGQSNQITYGHIFEKLVGTTTRIPRASLLDIFRSQLTHYKTMTANDPKHTYRVDLALIEFLAEYLKEIRIRESELTIVLDFTPKVPVVSSGGASGISGAAPPPPPPPTHYDLHLPSVRLWTIESKRHGVDRFLIAPDNKLKEVFSAATVFRLANAIRFEFDENGIRKSMENDIQVIKGIPMSINFKTRYDPSHEQLEFQSKLPMLLTAPSGKVARSKDGTHYVPRKSKMWMVLDVPALTALHPVEIWLAIPDIALSRPLPSK